MYDVKINLSINPMILLASVSVRIHISQILATITKYLIFMTLNIYSLLMSRVVTDGPVISKSQKMVLDAALLHTQQYNVSGAIQRME